MSKYTDSLPPLPQEDDYLLHLRNLVERINGFVYPGDRSDAIMQTIKVLRADPDLASALLNRLESDTAPPPREEPPGTPAHRNTVAIHIVDAAGDCVELYGREGFQKLFNREPTPDYRFDACAPNGTRVTFPRGACLSVSDVFAQWPNHDPADLTQSLTDQARQDGP